MADRTQLIEGLLKRFGLRRETRPKMPSQVTALDLEGLTLRVVQTRARGAIGQVVSGVLDLAPEADRNDPAIMGAALRRTLNRLGIRPTAVVMGVPRARVVLRTLTVPEIGRVDELASLVHFQVAKDLPFRLEDAVIDFRVLRRIVATTETPVEKEPILAPEGAGATKVEVLAAVVRRDEVDSYQRLAEAAGFRLVGLGLLPDANARCIQACRLEASQDATALVTIRPEEVGIDIVADGALRAREDFVPGAEERTTAVHPQRVRGARRDQVAQRAAAQAAWEPERPEPAERPARWERPPAAGRDAPAAEPPAAPRRRRRRTGPRRPGSPRPAGCAA